LKKICCNDGVGLFAIGIATLKPQHLQTMTLITQHKPIERSTNTAFMTKKTQIQAWLIENYSLHGAPLFSLANRRMQNA
jgi:hypothetical protein